ncbi:MAG: response regulator [Syntrophobacteraceae bacterium]
MEKVESLMPILKPFHVIVVEDDDMTRELLKIALDKVCAVVSFADAESAWKHLLNGDRTDLVIADVEMPGMGGIALLQRTRERFPCVGCVMISGNSENEKQSIDSGADFFLAKPFPLKKLIEVVRRFQRRSGN